MLRLMRFHMYRRDSGASDPRRDDIVVRYFLIPTATVVVVGLVILHMVISSTVPSYGVLGAVAWAMLIPLGVVIKHKYFTTIPPRPRPYRGRHRRR